MQKAKITIHPDYRIGEIDRRLFGAFLEPIGSWIYGSIWNPRHPLADDMGFRRDILEMTKELGIPAIRMPGGNFTSAGSGRIPSARRKNAGRIWIWPGASTKPMK